MHRTVPRLRSCCQPRLRWYLYNIHNRRLSSAGTVPATKSDKEVLGTLEPWQDGSGKTLARRKKDAKDIIVDDLSATLEAHRASNRAAVIRKVKLDSDGSIWRPLLGKYSDGRSEAKKTHERKEIEPPRMWPADSVQAKERYGSADSRGFVKSADPLEYTGVAQWPKKPWKINHSSEDMLMQRPWLVYMESTSEDYLERLTSEIKAYETYMRLSPQEEAASQLVISDVNSVARTEPEIKPLTLLGSRSSGLATPISDFDFTFTLPNVLAGGWILPPSEADVNQAQSLNHEDKLKAVKALRKVERHFRSSSKFSNTDSVRHARVPIIRSKHVATGLDVQIQTMAPYQAAQEYTVAYLSEFPSLRPLYIILRYCLEVRGLTTVFEGGLGSYSILMMIATAMKHSSGKFASDDLAGQLLHVLEFYGKADLYKVGFSANPPRVFEKQKERWLLAERMARMNDPQLSGIDRMQKYYPRKPYLLCLQDPANDVSDLGKNAYAIKHIQATFNKARESIQSAIEEQKERTNARAKGWIWSSLDSLVRADYRPFEESRNKVERCANPGELVDRDYSTERINKEFKRRVYRYKGVAEEDDDFPEPALEAIEENAAVIIEAGDGLSDGTRLAWYRKIRESRARTKRRQAREKTIAAERKQKIRKLQVQKKNGTNDDGFGDDQYGWEPSSPSDQKTLLEAIAAPKLALAARTPAASRRATRAKLFRKHTSGPMRTISKHFKHDEIREHIVPDDKITRATGPTTSPHRGAVDTAIPTTFSNPKPPNPGPEAPKPAPKASTSDDDKHVHGDDDEGKLVKKVHLDAFNMRRTMMPSYKRDAAPGEIDTRLESDGAFLPRSQQGR